MDLILRGERLELTASAAAQKAHPDVVRTTAGAARKIWWLAMDKQAELATETCIGQAADKSTKVTSTLQLVPLPDLQGPKLGMDSVSPLERASHNCRVAITLVNFFSKWPEVHLSSLTATRTVSSFLVCVFAREVYP